MANEDPMVAVILRNQFYRRQYLLGFGVFVVSVLGLCALVMLLVHIIRNPVAPLYFATDNVGRLIDVTPVSKPNMTTEQAAAWTIRAVEQATSFDYVNYRRQMQGSEKYFTDYGWHTYLSALKETGNLIAVQEKKMIITAKVVGQPEVLVEGPLGDVYAWKFRMPMLVTFWQPPYDDNSSFQNAWVVNVIIKRESILQSVDGLGILQLLITAASPKDIPAPGGSS